MWGLALYSPGGHHLHCTLNTRSFWVFLEACLNSASRAALLWPAILEVWSGRKPRPLFWGFLLHQCLWYYTALWWLVLLWPEQFQPASCRAFRTVLAGHSSWCGLATPVLPPRERRDPLGGLTHSSRRERGWLSAEVLWKWLRKGQSWGHCSEPGTQAFRQLSVYTRKASAWHLSPGSLRTQKSQSLPTLGHGPSPEEERLVEKDETLVELQLGLNSRPTVWVC